MTTAEEAQAELGSLMGRLARESGAYVAHGRLRPEDGGLAARGSSLVSEIYTLVYQAHEEWARQDSYVQMPASHVEIEAGLVALARHEAAATMARFASECPLWNVTLMDSSRALRHTSRVVQILGPDAQWWSNHDDLSSDSFTGCTVDSLVAGTDGTVFAVLLQSFSD
ncbi:hypothetical protein [Streptomyces sp. NBC_00859]|uniref:hypothetical protein n=1 Tax=Streptomyces sp. NBC_00859 TaxID=2903682 RepID=UPI00386B5C9B|nr:hypothetical protein OG584_06490 [Streptomyces sp. NBC_00859]